MTVNPVLDAVLADRNQIKAELADMRKAATLAYGLLWLFQGNSDDNPMCKLAFTARITLRDALRRDDLKAGITEAKETVKREGWSIPIEGWM